MNPSMITAITFVSTANRVPNMPARTAVVTMPHFLSTLSIMNTLNMLPKKKPEYIRNENKSV